MHVGQTRRTRDHIVYSHTPVCEAGNHAPRNASRSATSIDAGTSPVSSIGQSGQWIWEHMIHEDEIR